MQFPLQKSHAHRVCKDVRIYFDLRNDPLIYYRLSGAPDKKPNIGKKKMIFIVFTPWNYSRLTTVLLMLMTFCSPRQYIKL